MTACAARTGGGANTRAAPRRAGDVVGTRRWRMAEITSGFERLENAGLISGAGIDQRRGRRLSTGQRVTDHWENGFGEGPYAGHAFSMGVQITREGDAPPRGQGRDQID